MKIFPNLQPPKGLRRITCTKCKKRTNLGIMSHIEGRNWATIYYEHFCYITNRHENVIKEISYNAELSCSGLLAICSNDLLHSEEVVKVARKIDNRET